ncbi:rhomboid protease GluP [Herbinix hemicellulosilytica]|uniref:Peptidase S54 rhomboid domain-containing protein n=1 Tax=Herbinix hemicellulosilytica TaxID=1564487 RepID=A0A0H5SZD2_HERHM|nr:rhomboid family intramembrane serine protease [Herbinix hemicellulosilytica]RBP57900.1 rhomboid protease GluP [Herbinix hemicellulosilytica]CRZ35748.1 hypothetical protein HHT355_2565 [Herbinix hemicellulosilytica]
MRIEDGIIRLLLDKEYKWLETKLNNIDMFYRTDISCTDIVLILRVLTATEITAEEYKFIVDNIKNLFNKQGFTEVKLLGLIFTAFADRARKYCLDEDDHIIVDISNRRLLVYEKLTPCFLEIISSIEEIIHDESYDADINPAGYAGEYKEYTNNKEQWLTLINTLLVAANIIIFLLVHISNAFGETDDLIHRGALSWYRIKIRKEYYRVFTSMFLHSDFEHLMNNMLVLFFVGDKLERIAGKIKYLIIYFGAGIIAAIFSIGYNMLKNEPVFSIGASGAIFGIVGAMVYILFVNKGRLQGISTRQIILFTVFSLYGGIVNTGIDNAAHIGGFIAGIILSLLLYRRPKKITKENRRKADL